MATTLHDFATQERDTYAALRTKADEALAKAQTALTGAQTRREEATKALATLEQEVGDIRKKLGEIPSPADGHALLVDLEERMIGVRTRQAAILDAEEDVAGADAQVKSVRAGLAVAVARLAEAASALETAKARATRLADWTTALGKPPLSDLPGDADAALNSPPRNEAFTKARQRIQEDIPQPLRDRARERGTQARQRLKVRSDAAASAETARLAEWNKTVGATPQALEKAQREFDAAEAALRDYLTRGRERYQLAAGLLSRIVSALPLTPAEKDRIADPLVAARATAALALEKARDTAQVALEAKQLALDDATSAALASAPTANPDDDGAVKAAKTERDKAKEDLDKANAALATSALQKARDDTAKEAADKQKASDDIQGSAATQEEKDSAADAAQQAQARADEARKAFEDATKARDDAKAAVPTREKELKDARTAAAAKVPPVDPESDPAVKDARTALALAKNELAKAERRLITIGGGLDVWEAAVLDTSWRMLADFDEAERILTDLKDSKPSDLLKAVKDTEAALVAARESTTKSARALVVLEGDAAERRARLEQAREAAPARFLSALRGDR
jgi:hypothetical protein